jgi:hypothetical protein
MMGFRDEDADLREAYISKLKSSHVGLKEEEDSVI